MSKKLIIVLIHHRHNILYLIYILSCLSVCGWLCIGQGTAVSRSRRCIDRINVTAGNHKLVSNFSMLKLVI
jgi:hypothetical protein